MPWRLMAARIMSRLRRKRAADDGEGRPLSYRDRQAAANRRADRWCAVIVVFGVVALVSLIVAYGFLNPVDAE